MKWMGASSARARRALPLIGLAPLLVTASLGQCPKGFLKAPQPVADEFFGFAVDLLGRCALVGAPGGDAAYLLAVDQKVATTSFAPSDPDFVSKSYGQAVALAPGVAVIGAPFDDAVASGAGAAYLHDPLGGSELAKLTAPDGHKWQGFGTAVDTDGALVVVGAPGDVDMGSGAGAVYALDAATGSLAWKFTAADGAPNDRLGQAVHLTGTLLLAGATGHDGGRGAVYVVDAGTGQGLAKLVNTSLRGLGVGESLDSDGTLVVAGSWESSSSALVFDLASGAVVSELEMEGRPATVQLAGGRAWVGDPASTAVFVFDAWTGRPLNPVFTSQGEVDDLLGRGLAVRDDLIVVGAPYGAVGAKRPGKAYVFSVCEAIGVRYCSPAVDNSTGAPGLMTVLGSPVVADGELVLRATSLPSDRFGLFLASRTQGFLANPGGSTGHLCLGGTIGRYAQKKAKSNWSGQLQIRANLAKIPTDPPSAVQPGDTWNFQAWYRDGMGSGPSNFTDAVSVSFQ